MAATTVERNTRKRGGYSRSLPMKGSTKVLAGTLVCIDANNVLTPAITATGLVCVGVAADTVDNTGAAGALRCEVERGVFGPFANSAAGDAIALKDIGATCFLVDNQTLALTNGTNTRSAAGRVFDVDAEGVWLHIV